MTERARLTCAVLGFAGQMIEKLHKKLTEGYHVWENSQNQQIVIDELQAHYEKFIAGDTAQAVDVANLVMILKHMRDKKEARNANA